MFDSIDWGRADVWIAIAVLVVATGATRSTFWLVGHHIRIPRRVGKCCAMRRPARWRPSSRPTC
jgi:hypothetical protein